jgi:hypothetical protein
MKYLYLLPIFFLFVLLFVQAQEDVSPPTTSFVYQLNEGILHISYPTAIPEGTRAVIQADYTPYTSSIEPTYHLVLQTEQTIIPNEVQESSFTPQGTWHTPLLFVTTSFTMYLFSNMSSSSYLLHSFSIQVSAKINTTGDETPPTYMAQEGDFCNKTTICADTLYCIAQQCHNCLEPFLLITADAACSWNCGSGTEPNPAVMQCTCKQGYQEDILDDLGRLTCTLIETEDVAQPTNQTNLFALEGEACDDETVFCLEPLLCQELICRYPNTTTQSPTNETHSSFVDPVETISDDVLTATQEESQENNSSTTSTSTEQFQNEPTSTTTLPLVEESDAASLITPQDVSSSVLPARNEELEGLLRNAKERVLLLQKNQLLDNQSSTALQAQAREQVISLVAKNQQEQASFSLREREARESAIIQKDVSLQRIIHENDTSFLATEVRITITPKKNKTAISIIEVIPKEFAAHVSELAFSIQPTILEEDPVVMWHLEDVTQPTTITYTVAKNTSLTGNTVALGVAPRVIRWELLFPLLFIPLLAGIIIFFNRVQREE